MHIVHKVVGLLSGSEQSNVVLLVWCKRGKHRSVGLAEAVSKIWKARGLGTTVTWHLEQARWDHATRRRWGMPVEHSVPLRQAFEQADLFPRKIPEARRR